MGSGTIKGAGDKAMQGEGAGKGAGLLVQLPLLFSASQQNA